MIRLVIFDLDGTLWRGNEPIQGAAESLSELRRKSVQIRFLTNNSSISSEEVARKLTGMGFEANRHEVMGSGPFSAQVCQSRGMRSVYVVGGPALEREFSSFDKAGADADAVVVGIDRGFTYDKCSRALQLIRRGARFIATNRDATYPLEGGRVEPGAGAIVAAIEAASGVAPEVLGKPNPAMINQLLDEAGVEPGDCLVVGDRMETDIAAGQAAGCQTALVLTGATIDPVSGVRVAVSVPDLLSTPFD
ncbi:MAG: HAD-IIA family hydrolase [Chthonomonas sp.]|nr:HAD-IIA family hydrolase [Chthonomonas sp.]